MPQYTEGQKLKGSDGNIYVVRNGVPVRDAGPTSSPFANPKLPYETQSAAGHAAAAPYEAPKSAADLEGQRLINEQRRLDIERLRREQSGADTPGDTTKTGEEYLATLPPGMAGQVRAIADGRRAIPTNSRNKEMMALIAAATQYDPTLDAANSATRVATRKDFTSGVTSRNITALNTALGHLGSLSAAAKELKNTSIPLANTVKNTVVSEFGDPRVKNFNIRRQAVVDELERVFRGAGGGTEAGIQAWKEQISSADSPEQLKKAISGAVELLDSRLQALGDQYQRGMGHSADPMTFLSPHAQEVYKALGPGGSGEVPEDGPVKPQLGDPPGAPQLGLASGSTRNEYDQVTSAGLDALIRRGRPYDEAAAYVESKGGKLDPIPYAQAVAFHKAHKGQPEDKGSYARATKTVPVSLAQRLASSPAGAFFAAGGNALTAGYLDEATAGINSTLGGGDYTQLRDEYNAKKNILAQQNPTSDLLGNVAGGVTGVLGGEAALGRVAPGAINFLSGTKFAKALPAATDAAYGGMYGAGENNQDRAGGAVGGALAGLGGGMFARGAMRGAGRIIAPVAGKAAPLYEQGVFPTIGQRAGMMEGPIASRLGKAVNVTEQAMQSVPGLGALPAIAREGARKEFQVGAFNQSLADLGARLPPGTHGTAAHEYTANAFNKAYDTARTNMQFVADAPYAQELGQFQQSLGDGTLTAEQQRHVADTIGKALNGRVKNGAMDGQNYKAAVSDLGRIAGTWSKNPATQAQADYLLNFQTLIDNAARRNSSPEAAALLDKADSGYAKFVRIQKASERGGAAKDAGSFSPTDYAGAVKQMGGGLRSNAYSRGSALGQDYAEAGLGLRDTVADSGTPVRLMTAQGAVGAGLGATGHAALLTNPVTLGMFAPYALGKLGRKAIAPRNYFLPPELAQPLNALGNGIYDRSSDIGRLGAPTALGMYLGSQ